MNNYKKLAAFTGSEVINVFINNIFFTFIMSVARSLTRRLDL